MNFTIKTVSSSNIEEKKQIRLINATLSKINKTYFRINMPHRNVIFFSIFNNFNFLSNIFNKINNFHLINKDIGKIDDLPEIFFNERFSLLSKKNERKKIIEDNAVLGLYMDMFHFYMIQKEEMIDLVNNLGYRIIALIADPIVTVLSWISKESHNFSNLIIGGNYDKSIWARLNCNTSDKIERMAILWEYYANFCWQLRNVIKVYTYEQVNSSLSSVIQDFCSYFSLPDPEHAENKKFRLFYAKEFDLDQIKNAVDKYCHSKDKFGYSEHETSMDEVWDSEPVIFSNTVPKI